MPLPIRHCFLVLVALLSLFGATLARADAIVRTQAMSASTIAEFFVEENAVTLELEIGVGDLKAFANLLPDEIYERLGHPPVAWADRLVSFFGENLIVQVDTGAPIPGRILHMEPRPRVRRDPITGEPLPPTDEEPELVVFARIEYALPVRPPTLTVGGSIAGAAGIGFVLYHRSIAVNDFRYLSPVQTVMLDWDDPWYSSFENRALRRAYFAPMSGFIYVEPYEVRKEIIVRPKDLQQWIDLGLAGRTTLPVEMQTELKLAVADFLRHRQPVEIDGRVIEPELAQINFLERSLKSSQVIDPPVELDLDSAILGVIFVYRTGRDLPQQVTMAWDLFNEKINLVPASSVDQAGPLPSYLEPDHAILEWKNFLTNPQLPTMAAIAMPPGDLSRWSARLRWPLLVASALLVVWLVRAFPAGSGARGHSIVSRSSVLLVAVALTGGSFWLGGGAGVSDERASAVVSGLLHNIYRAFDFREEEQIYDVLEQSVHGDLLTRIYLETRKGLELANQGGARAKVKQIDLIELSAQRGKAGSFVADTLWHVTGSVGHWGHVHQRRNQYRARLDVRPVAGAWKLVELEILEEQRL